MYGFIYPWQSLRYLSCGVRGATVSKILRTKELSYVRCLSTFKYIKEVPRGRIWVDSQRSIYNIENSIPVIGVIFHDHLFLVVVLKNTGL